MTKSQTPATVQLTLDGETDVVIRRDFAHPPARVWRGLTEPALISRWLGGLTRCEMDLRPGGSFRYEWPEFTFFGPVVAVDAPFGMTHVEHFSRDPAYRCEVITRLEARGSGTRMTKSMRYASAEAREAAIAAGFTHGMEDVYGRLDALLTEA